MVSLRRRRALGLCNGNDAFQVELPKATENNKDPEAPKHNAKPFSVHPLPSVTSSPEKPVNITEASPIVSVSSSSKEKIENYLSDRDVKRRKRHRRKLFEDEETFAMRGVYLKNMKWQAAIKVDKKQIHLGTVETQEEAAKLYDRAAFMCGRETNFELPEEEKRELRLYTWEKFLEVTRSTLNSKKSQRRLGVGNRKQPNSQLQHGSEGGIAMAASLSVDEEVGENAVVS